MRWSTIPVSVAAHTALLAFLLFLPGAADLPAPWPATGIRAFVPEPAAVPDALPRSPDPVARPARGAPTRAAAGITNEPPAPVVSVAPAIEGGLPAAGIGTALGVPDGALHQPLPHPPPESVPERPAFVRPGGQIREPKKIVHVPAVYPDLARNARIEGTVLIEAVIDERGLVTGARVLKSVPLLDNAALAAVTQWRYTPTLLNGEPVKVLLTITFNFRLGERAP